MCRYVFGSSAVAHSRQHLIRVRIDFSDRNHILCQHPSERRNHCNASRRYVCASKNPPDVRNCVHTTIALCTLSGVPTKPAPEICIDYRHTLLGGSSGGSSSTVPGETWQFVYHNLTHGVCVAHAQKDNTLPRITFAHKHYLNKPRTRAPHVYGRATGPRCLRVVVQQYEHGQHANTHTHQTKNLTYLKQSAHSAR